MVIGICGAGTMGKGIAVASLQAGHHCVVFDLNDELVQSCHGFVRKQMEIAVSKSKMTESAMNDSLGRLSTTIQVSDLSGCDIVIEAIVERSDAKDHLFAELEKVVSASCILATNTSSIAVASLARKLTNPSRFIGLHFFNPAHIMKLVEIIPCPGTSELCLAQSLLFIKELGKSPAVAKDVPGFIVNRVARNYYNESQRIVSEGGANIRQVDAIIKAHGFKMGPFELMDLIGVDVNLDVTKSMYQQYFFEPRFQPSLLQQQYVDAGLHGRKSGRGFYDYRTKATE